MMINTQTSIKEKYHELLSKINWELVFQNLGLEPKNKGDYLEILCPKCKERRAFFYLNTDAENHKIICNRKNECAFESHILEHINNGVFPKGYDWKNSVEKLASLSGTPITLESKFPVKSQPLQKERYILKDYWQFLQDQFPNSPAEKYIVENRKLDPTKTTFGYVPEDVHEVIQWTKKMGYSEEALIRCGILVQGQHGKFISLRGRLAGAFIDQMGNVHNIWGRGISGNPTENRRYINLKDSEFAHKKGPYGAERVRDGIVVWLEGYLDVAAAQECGIVAVASGTSSIPEDMVKSLKGLHTVVTAMDNDGAGKEGTFRFIEKNVNNEAFKIFSINNELMKGCKDISELYQKHGKETVKEIFLPDNLEHAFTTAQRYILAKNKDGETWTPVSKENALEAASAFDKRVVASSKIPLFQDYFWKNGIQKELGLDEKALGYHIDNLRQKKEKEHVKNQIETLTRLAGNKASEGDLNGAGKILSQLTQLYSSYSSDAKDTSIKFIKELGRSWLETEPSAKEMLLSFTNEKGLAQGFLPRSIVAMLAGPGGVGKSHLMTQLAVSVATGFSLFGKYYPKRAGAVFLGMGENSKEDLRRIIWKSTKGLNEAQKKSVISNLAPYSFHGQNSAFLEAGKPSGYFYKLKEELIRKAPENGGWDLLIFDPASRLLGVDSEKDNAQATLFITLLEQLTEDVPGNPTVLFTHHVNKSSMNQANSNGQQDQSAARGASALTDGCRWQVNFFKYKDKGTYTLSMVKTNFTAIMDPIPLEKDKNGSLKCTQEGW